MIERNIFNMERIASSNRAISFNFIVVYAINIAYMTRMFDHCIYFNTTALARQLDRIWTQAFKPFELTPPQGFMLRAVLDRPAMLQSELADGLKIARATATRALDGLEARGLIERRGSKRDGRETEIHPTPAALGLKDGLNRASGEVTKKLKAKLGGGEFDSFVAQAKAITASVG